MSELSRYRIDGALKHVLLMIHAPRAVLRLQETPLWAFADPALSAAAARVHLRNSDDDLQFQVLLAFRDKNQPRFYRSEVELFLRKTVIVSNRTCTYDSQRKAETEAIFRIMIENPFPRIAEDSGLLHKPNHSVLERRTATFKAATARPLSMLERASTSGLKASFPPSGHETQELTNRELVLAVDDSETNNIAVRRMLEPCGYLVATAINADEAIRFLLEKPALPDLILLDIVRVSLTCTLESPCSCNLRNPPCPR